MTTILQTPRLRLREFTTADTAFILELFNSPGWLQFIGDRKVRTTDEALQYLENGPMKSYRENGYGLSLVETTAGNTPIGMCGILKRDTLVFPDIGFAFLPQFSGKGYAFEIASATLHHAKKTLRLPTITAITSPANERSIRLLEKIGLNCQGNIRLAPDGEELLLYSG